MNIARSGSAWVLHTKPFFSGKAMVFLRESNGTTAFQLRTYRSKAGPSGMGEDRQIVELFVSLVSLHRKAREE